MAHRSTNDKGEYEGWVYLPITAENNFTAEISVAKVDLIYLASLPNPTGAIAQGTPKGVGGLCQSP